MQAWEYLVVEINWGKEPARMWKVNGSELRDWKQNPHFSESLNQLGAEGWEVVCFVSTNQFLLKRPKQ
jgi:hypothetical protein